MRKTPLKKFNQKSRDKRKQEREDFPEFYTKHINYIKENNVCCQECGQNLLGDVSEVAHILPKSRFKSVSTEDKNILYLCGWKTNSCHSKFDNSSNEVFKQMNIFEETAEKVEELLKIVTEKINWKLLDRYE